MKGAVVAGLHALAAVGTVADAAPDVVLQCVASEEDGGLGTFAELERDAAFDAALIPEPTGFDVVCAQAGALTFRCVVPGRAAHAAHRLAGCSAIDRYVRVHAALHALERQINADVAHPLMRELELPYPLLVGRVAGGEWSSQVPDRRRGRGPRRRAARRRPGSRAGGARARGGERARRRRSARPRCTGPAAPSCPPRRPPITHGCASWRARSRTSGATRRAPSACPGAPTCACSRPAGSRARWPGTTGIERAHAVDEWVSVDELAALARVLVRAILRAALVPS